MAHGREQLLTAPRRHNTLDAIDRELIIVRVAALNDACFEYEAHVPIVPDAGATQASLDTVSDPARIVDGLPEATGALIDLTDAMTRRPVWRTMAVRTLSASNHQQQQKRHPKVPQVIDLIGG